MEQVYEMNAPTEIPATKDQPQFEEKSIGIENTNLLVPETISRWKMEVLDKIQYLKENFEQANQDREGLSQEVDRLKSALAASQQRVQDLEKKMAETLETFNRLMEEVSGVLQT
jgi:predicted nuclease with TOPRIM domain